MTRAPGAERSGQDPADTVLVCGVAHRRNRPSLTVTIDPELDRRLRALVELLPGSSLSIVVDELLTAALPTYEGMAQAIHEARSADGLVDEARARRLAGAFIGSMVARAIEGELQDQEPPQSEEVR